MGVASHLLFVGIATVCAIAALQLVGIRIAHFEPVR